MEERTNPLVAAIGQSWSALSRTAEGLLLSSSTYQSSGTRMHSTPLETRATNHGGGSWSFGAFLVEHGLDNFILDALLGEGAASQLSDQEQLQKLRALRPEEVRSGLCAGSQHPVHKHLAELVVEALGNLPASVALTTTPRRVSPSVQRKVRDGQDSQLGFASLSDMRGSFELDLKHVLNDSFEKLKNHRSLREQSTRSALSERSAMSEQSYTSEMLDPSPSISSWFEATAIKKGHAVTDRNGTIPEP